MCIFNSPLYNDLTAFHYVQTQSSSRPEKKVSKAIVMVASTSFTDLYSYREASYCVVDVWCPFALKDKLKKARHPGKKAV